MCPYKYNLFFEKQDIFYRAISNNQDTLRKSSSGGIVHEIANTVIGVGGIVYGAAWNLENQRVEHMCVENIAELPIIQESKYFQSIIPVPVYKAIRSQLKEKKVLFIGTPCE